MHHSHGKRTREQQLKDNHGRYVTLAWLLLLTWVIFGVFATTESLAAHPTGWFSGLFVVLMLLLWAMAASHFSRTSLLRKMVETVADSRLLMDSTVEGIIAVDRDGLCTRANRSAIQMLGYPNEAALVGKPLHDAIHHTRPNGEEYPRDQCPIMSSALENKPCHKVGEILWRQDQSSFPAEYWTHPIQRDNAVIGAVITFIDVSDRHEFERELLTLYHAMEQSTSGIAILDHAGELRYMNRTFGEITGLSRVEFGSSMQSDVWPDSLLARQRADAIRTGSRWAGEYHITKSTGEISWYRESISPVLGRDADNPCYAMVVEDISKRRAAEANVRHMAYHDILTGLPNRNSLKSILEAQSSIPKTHFAVCYMDIDRFKNVNDVFGHTAGDDLLVEFSKRLRNGVRPVDSVCRLGGNGFAVVLGGSSEVAEVGPIIDRVIDNVCRPAFIVDGRDVYVTVSTGISLFPVDSSSIDDLMKKADVALYHAKDAGKNVRRFYREDIHDVAIGKVAIEMLLRNAIDRGEMYLEFQPKVNLLSGKIMGSEALLRWFNKDLGQVPPDRFIPVAEDSNIIIPMGRWVIDETCRRLSEMTQSGYRDHIIAINISAIQFQDPELLDQIRASLRQYDVAPERMEIEITESALMNNHAEASAVIVRLREMGINASIDDFGTGYSSLAYLKNLPVAALKIDRSFVQHIASSQSDRAIAEAIIVMAHALKLEVIAEGVEDDAQRVLLSDMGCTCAQGYYFSRPVAFDSLMVLLTNEQ